MTYRRFLAMILSSTVVMYGLMYLNTYALDHVYFSETRAWMALYMGAVMTIIMLGFMWRHYESRPTNFLLMAGALAVFAGSPFFLRSQATVDDVDWMRAMIPHHSIAILTSERADLSDPRVRDFAQRIIDAQRSEIAEMQTLISSLVNSDPMSQ